MKGVQITVVIPIYNVEKYLRQCLDSVARQREIRCPSDEWKQFDSSRYEVILVDDGSTDASGAIASEYCRRDSRFRLISQHNRGLSAARNTGIREARGEYICFVDSDDHVSPDYLRCLYEAAVPEKADLVICEYQKVDESGRLLEEPGQHESVISDRTELLSQLTVAGASHDTVRTVVAWNKLIRTKIMQRHPYPEGVYHEDEFVIAPLLLDCSKICAVGQKLYFYRQRENSIMQQKKIEVSKYLAVLGAYEQRIGQCQDQGTGLIRQLERSYLQNIMLQYLILREKNVPKQEIWPHLLPHLKRARKQYGADLNYKQKLKAAIFQKKPDFYWNHFGFL